VPVEALHKIEGQVPIYPPPEALRYSQDRLDEKQLFDHLSIPLPGYRAIDSREQLAEAADALGLPLVIKTRRLGYDGKGQFVLRKAGQIDDAWRAVGGTPLIAEQWVPFDYEVSCIGARNADGEIAMYPLSRVCGDDLLANEFAPRVHNSGHWSIEGSATSQIENHLRAIMNQPLGSTASRGHAGMINLIGEIPPAARTLQGTALHDYGKSPRPGRKLGHITVTAPTAAERDARLDEIMMSVIVSI
jgi:5-(carboxyamino)imidazole ribonucleotide synthase